MPSQELREVSLLSPEEYVDVLARTGLGMVCKLDRSGRILTFDDACERVTGFTAAEVLGRDARDVVIPPEERNAFGIFLEQFAEIAVSRPQVGHWLTKDGERRQIAWSNRPITDEDGTVTGLLTVGLDLTERDRAAAQVEALHSELEERLAEVEVLAREQAALRRVATLVAGEADPALIFEAVAVETGRLARVRTAAVVRYGVEGATVVGALELRLAGGAVPGRLGRAGRRRHGLRRGPADRGSARGSMRTARAPWRRVCAMPVMSRPRLRRCCSRTSRGAR